MFRLEKVFQNDDSGFIIFNSLIKSIILFIIIYAFSILYENTIYELLNIQIFINSNFFFYNILLTLFYLIFSFILKNRIEYKKNFLSFLREDVLNIFFSNITSFSTFFILGINDAYLANFFYGLSALICVLIFWLNYFVRNGFSNSIVSLKNIKFR